MADNDGVDELFDFRCNGLALVEARIEPHNPGLCSICYLTLYYLAGKYPAVVNFSDINRLFFIR